MRSVEEMFIQPSKWTDFYESVLVGSIRQVVGRIQLLFAFLKIFLTLHGAKTVGVLENNHHWPKYYIGPTEV
jgi:hypothetical protein